MLLLSTGLLAGAFLIEVAGVRPALNELPVDAQVAFKQGWIRFTGWVMPPLVASALVFSAVAGFISQPVTTRITSGFAVLSLGLVLVVSIVFHLPLNHEILSWSAAELPSNSSYQLGQWNLYDNVRAAAAIFAFVIQITVIVFFGR